MLGNVEFFVDDGGLVYACCIFAFVGVGGEPFGTGVDHTMER